MEPEIHFLADRPEALATMTQWVHGEWGHKFGVSLKQMEGGFRRRGNRDRVPFTLVGELDGKPVGTSTVVACDLPARRDLYPWLAAVYVDPACRGKGFGAALVQAACAHVASLGNERLYLYPRAPRPSTRGSDGLRSRSFRTAGMKSRSWLVTWVPVARRVDATPDRTMHPVMRVAVPHPPGVALGPRRLCNGH